MRRSEIISQWQQLAKAVTYSARKARDESLPESEREEWNYNLREVCAAQDALSAPQPKAPWMASYYLTNLAAAKADVERQILDPTISVEKEVALNHLLGELDKTKAEFEAEVQKDPLGYQGWYFSEVVQDPAVRIKANWLPN